MLIKKENDVEYYYMRKVK